MPDLRSAIAMPDLRSPIAVPEPPLPGAYVRRALAGDIPAIVRARLLVEEEMENRGTKQWPVGSIGADALAPAIEEGLWWLMVAPPEEVAAHREAHAGERGGFGSPPTTQPAVRADISTGSADGSAGTSADLATDSATQPTASATSDDGAARLVVGPITGERAMMPARQPLAYGETLLATVSWHESDDLWADAPPGEGRYLHSLMANPEAAVRGAGKQMLRWAAERARVEGARYLRLDTLSTNDALTSMYSSLGFTRVGTLFWDDHWYSAALFEMTLQR